MYVSTLVVSYFVIAIFTSKYKAGYVLIKKIYRKNYYNSVSNRRVSGVGRPDRI
jgi:hypothetical protein